MIPQSRIQNFARRKATIVSSSKDCVDRLQSTLIKIGVQLRRIEESPSMLCFDTYSLHSQEDVIFIDGDVSGTLSVPEHPHTHFPVVPIIGMVGSEAPSRLGRLMSIGATSFIKKPIQVDSVFSTLFMAVNTHNDRIALAEKVTDLEARRQARRYVIKAVAVLMQEFAVNDEQAYDMLRRQSMHEQTTIEIFSKKVIERQSQLFDSIRA